MAWFGRRRKRDQEQAAEHAPQPAPEQVVEQVAEQTGAPTAQAPAQAPVEALVDEAPAPTDGPTRARWNPNLGGAVVRIVAAGEPGDDNAALLRAAVQDGLARAVGPDSPAPADAPEDYPVVLDVTVAEDIADEVGETLAAMRKQLARSTPRVRLVVAEVPRAEL